MKMHFSNHARKRFRERFKNYVTDNNVVLSLHNTFRQAKENKSFLNNTRFVTHVYETHGYEPFEIFIHEKILFLCKKGVLVTVWSTDNSMFDIRNSRF